VVRRVLAVQAVAEFDGGAQRTNSLRIGEIESVLHRWQIPWSKDRRHQAP